MNVPERGHCLYETARSYSRCRLPKPHGLFRSGVKEFDYGPEPDCFYIDLFKKKDEQDKFSYVQTGQVDLVWICFL